LTKLEFDETLSGMEKPLRILHLEDEPLDIELLEGELRRLQLSYSLEQVDTEPAFVRSRVSMACTLWHWRNNTRQAYRLSS
jgi:hypothetical protein